MKKNHLWAIKYLINYYRKEYLERNLFARYDFFLRIRRRKLTDRFDIFGGEFACVLNNRKPVQLLGN